VQTEAAPVDAEYLPIAQTAQEMADAEENVPIAQSTQEAAPTEEYLPATHDVQPD
jgi:hypothetical protein